MTKEQFNVAVGQAIQERRKAHGWTLDDVLPFVGGAFSRSSLSAIEHGRQELRIYEFFLLEKLLGALPRPEITMTLT